MEKFDEFSTELAEICQKRVHMEKTQKDVVWIPNHLQFEGGDDDFGIQFPIVMRWFGWQETPTTHGAKIGIGDLVNSMNKSKELCMELVDIKWQKWKVVQITEVSNDWRPDQGTFIFG